jgi:MoxR-like ATPase
LATQNPLEQEGTYPLPEAQQDRFMFHIRVDYPAEADEEQIITATTSSSRAAVERVVTAEDIRAMQDLVLKVPAASYVVRYASKLTRLTRPTGEAGVAVPDFVKKYVSWGAGPRAGQNLILAAKALLAGRTYVAIEDVRAAALPVLRHRVMVNYHAEAEGVTPDDIVTRLLQLVPRDGER